MWASTFIVTKAVFAEISPLAFIFVRFALRTLLAFGVLVARGARAQWHIRRADLLRFLLVGLCGYTGYQLGFVLGLDNTSPFSSSLLIAMVPFFTLVILAVSGERARLGYVSPKILLQGAWHLLANLSACLLPTLAAVWYFADRSSKRCIIESTWIAAGRLTLALG